MTEPNDTNNTPSLDVEMPRPDEGARRERSRASEDRADDDILTVLVDEARARLGRVFEDEVLDALLALRRRNQGAWIDLRERLCSVGVGRREIDAALKHRRQGNAAAERSAPVLEYAYQVRAGFEADQLESFKRLISQIKAPIFLREGELVRIVPMMRHRLTDDPVTGEKRFHDAPGVARVSPEWLVPELARICTFFALKRDRDGEVMLGGDGDPIRVPADVPLLRVQQALERPTELDVPHFAGITHAPTLRRNGTILSKPGYDPKTGLWLAGNMTLRPIADEPPKEEGAAALNVVESLLDNFFFADEQGEDGRRRPLNEKRDRAVALAMLLTAALRAAFPHCPAVFMNAPAPGSAKTYLQQTAFLLRSGKKAPVLAWPRQYEEFTKRLDGLQIGGIDNCMVDNANKVDIRGDEINQVITESTRNARRLGESATVVVSNENFLFMVNGNRVRASEDIAGKVIICNLDTRKANPRLDLQNYFAARVDPHEAITADWEKYVAAVLTAARAYIAAGSPGALSWPSFDGWSRLIRSMLVWYGRADVLETARASSDGDEDALRREAFMALVQAHIGFGVEFTIRELVRRINPNDENNQRRSDADLGVLREAWEALRGLRPGPQPNSVDPTYVSRQVGRVVHEEIEGATVGLGDVFVRIVKAGTSGGSSRWKAISTLL